MASEIRSSALARWMSSATCGTMLARPGWNMAVAAPLSASSAITCHSRTSDPTSSAASASMATIRTASAPTIITWGVNRSASTPPKSTSRTIGAIHAARAYPTPAAP